MSGIAPPRIEGCGARREAKPCLQRHVIPRNATELAGKGPPAPFQASHAVWLCKLPNEEAMTTAMFLVVWAKENHRDWFCRQRRVIAPSEADTDKTGQK